MVCHDRLLIGPPLLDDRRVVDDRTRHHAPRARMDGWWPCALGDFIQTYRARPTAVFWGIPGYAQPGVRRSWGKCASAFPSPTASASKCPARLTPGPFSWMNHLIRPPQHRRRDRQAEGLGRLEVDDQLELRRLLDGQVGGLAAFQNLVHVSGGAPIIISKVRSIGHKAPGIDKLPPWVHCRQPGLGRQVHEASLLDAEHDAWQHSQ